MALLIGFYVLLPLDHGFPRIPVFGRPLNSAIAATLAVLIVLAVQSELGIPVKLVGLGEGVEDLVEFDPDEFVEALFG